LAGKPRASPENFKEKLCRTGGKLLRTDKTQPDTILRKVSRAVRVLADAADEFEGLFPSIVDLRTLRMPEELPSKIAGQRNEDRAHPGSNLMHDKYVLGTMFGLGQSRDHGWMREAADRYINRFATHCTNTTTGLFPWGEHAFWDVRNDRIGNSFPLAYDWWTNPAIHDHLSATPFWLWEKLYEFNPRCVERFAEGLDYHWREGEPLEYCRHANIEIKERPPREGRSCDFPRHGGFYIMDWSFAYLKTGRADFLNQILRMLDYWWQKRDQASGLLPLESKTPPEITAIYGLSSPGQAMSLAMSLFETAEHLSHCVVPNGMRNSDAGERILRPARNHKYEERNDLASLAATMRERAAVYAGSFLALPHDLENDVWVDCTRLETGEIVGTMGCWGSVYGGGTAAGAARTCTAFYRMTGNEQFFRFAECVGRRYIREPIPEAATVPVVDAGLVIALFADLYDISRERQWLDYGLNLAGDFLPVYFAHDLPRGEAHIDYYDSQMGTGIFLQALARMALLAEDPDNCPLGPDYSSR